MPSQHAGAVSRCLREGASPASQGVSSVPLSADANLQLDPSAGTSRTASHTRVLEVFQEGGMG